MMQSPGCGPRRALVSAIVLALAGSAVAAEPRLRVVSPGTSRVIELTEASYEPGNRRLRAFSVAGNIECGNLPEPPAGALHLELDGRRYAINSTMLPAGLAAPVTYSPAELLFSLAIEGAISSDCQSTGVTTFDLVAVGPDGNATARSRIARAGYLHLPNAANPIMELALADAMHCETYGDDGGGIDQLLTYADGEQAMLFGIDRYEYRLTEAGGRRDLRQHSRISAAGIQLVQCTSPGLPMGRNHAAGQVPGLVFDSSFELADGAAEVGVTLASNSFRPAAPGALPELGYVVDSDGVFLTMTVRNTGRTDAAGVRIRELPGGVELAPMALDRGIGALTTCTPIPVDAEPDPCGGLAQLEAFPLTLALERLPVGQGLSITVNRRLVGPLDPAVRLPAGYAAFVDPVPGDDSAPDVRLGNNSQWVNFAVS
jgi:hypothetical protein